MTTLMIEGSDVSTSLLTSEISCHGIPNITFNTKTTELDGSFYLLYILIACQNCMGIYKRRVHLQKVYMNLGNYSRE